MDFEKLVDARFFSAGDEPWSVGPFPSVVEAIEYAKQYVTGFQYRKVSFSVVPTGCVQPNLFAEVSHND